MPNAVSICIYFLLCMFMFVFTYIRNGLVRRKFYWIGVGPGADWNEGCGCGAA